MIINTLDENGNRIEREMEKDEIAEFEKTRETEE